MQARDVNLTDPYRLWLGNPSPSYDMMIENFDSDFSFTGFGYNDPRKRKAFTPGSYHIRRGRRFVIGSFYWRKQDYYYGTWYPIRDHVVNEGIIDAGGNNGARVSVGCLPDSRIPTIAYNKALSKLYEQLRSSDLNLALTVGERKESAKMLRKAFAATASVVQKARHIRRQLLTNPSLLASNLWLQAKYGWIPLLSDIHAATEFHFHLFSEMKFKARASSRNEWKDYAWSNWLGNITVKRSHESRCQFVIYAGVANSDAYNLSRITSLNPLSIAWELVPLSFVVDWFYDIGGYLQNMEASLGTGLTFHRGIVTEMSHMRAAVPDSIVNNQFDQVYWSEYFVRNYAGYKLEEQNNWSEEISKTRTLLSGFPTPRAPVLRANLGSQRIISAAALIRQIVLGKVRGAKW